MKLTVCLAVLNCMQNISLWHCQWLSGKADWQLGKCCDAGKTDNSLERQVPGSEGLAALSTCLIRDTYIPATDRINRQHPQSLPRGGGWKAHQDGFKDNNRIRTTDTDWADRIICLQVQARSKCGQQLQHEQRKGSHLSETQEDSSRDNHYSAESNQAHDGGAGSQDPNLFDLLDTAPQVNDSDNNPLQNGSRESSGLHKETRSHGSCLMVTSILS